MRLGSRVQNARTPIQNRGKSFHKEGRNNTRAQLERPVPKKLAQAGAAKHSSLPLRRAENLYFCFPLICRASFLYLKMFSKERRFWLRAISNVKVKLQNGAPEPTENELAVFRSAIREHLITVFYQIIIQLNIHNLLQI